MSRKEKTNALTETGSDLVLETFLTVGVETGGEVLKGSFTSMIGEIAVDTASSLVPGLSGAVTGYKRIRFEQNIKKFAEELNERVQEISIHFEEKTEEQKKKIDQLFQFVLDYVIDEPQEEKIKYMVNGFLSLTKHEKISDDFVLTYYDVLKELRIVDISVLRLMYQSRYIFQDSLNETFQTVMERHGISYEQYQSVRRNLLRIGLLTTKTDLSLLDDLKEIQKRFKDLNSFLDKAMNPKNKAALPKLKELKLKSKESLELAPFGRDFVKFFMNIEKPED